MVDDLNVKVIFQPPLEGPMKRLNSKVCEQLSRHGFAIIEGLLSHSELRTAQAAAYKHLPSAAEVAQAPRKYESIISKPIYQAFPFADYHLNAISLAAPLLRFTSKALHTEAPFMTQSHLWAKYSESRDDGQGYHLDFDQNSLAYPSRRLAFGQLCIIIYYTDVDEEDGPTYVIDHAYANLQEPLIAAPSASEQTRLSDLEQPVIVPAGSALIYGMRTYHRGSVVRRPSGLRLTHHLVYRGGGHEWMGWRSWSRAGASQEMREFMVAATPEQRSAIGFPPPGHEYWDAEAIAGVAARYPGIDMTPYANTARRIYERPGQ
jgi:hypothetical protein